MAGGAGVTGCGVGTAVAGPAGCAVGGTAAVSLTVISTPKSDPVQVQDFRGEDGELSFTEAAAYAWSEFSQHLIGIGILIGVFVLLSTYLGARMKRPEEKAMERQVSTLLDKVAKMKE